MANPAGFALESGQGVLVAGVRPYPARESVRGRSNLKTVHWTVFPRQGAGRFSPHRISAGNRRRRALPGGGPLSAIAKGNRLPGNGARAGGIGP